MGGLAIYGGIIGVVIFLYFKCKKNKVDFLDLCDYLVPYLAIGQAIGRWGNFFNVEAYGKTAKSRLRMGIEVNGVYTEVHPVFLYESISTFIIFIILKIMQKNRKFKGQILYAYLCFYSFIRMFLEGLRVDSLMLGIFRISQVLSLTIFVIFSSFYFKNSIKNSKK